MDNKYLGKDIKLIGDDIQFSYNQDFSIVSDKENLAQAISSRLNTIQGEYKLSTSYGSELSSDLGLPNNDFIISAIQGHVLETINQEPRVKEFDIYDMSIENNTVNISIKITPINSNKSFNMIYPYFLG